MTDPIAYIFLDLDRTVIAEASFSLAANAAGIDQAVMSALKEKYRHDPTKGEEWNRATAELFRGIPVQKIHDALPDIPYSPGVREFCAKLDPSIAGTCIISSGVNIIAERVQRELGIDHCISNILHVDDDGILTGGITSVANMYNKNRAFVEFAIEKGIAFKKTLYIGDNDNDAPIMEFLKANQGHTIAFNPTRYPELREIADFTIYDFTDLTSYITQVNDRARQMQQSYSLVALEPKIVEAVGAFVPDEHGRIAMVRQKRRGMWNIPGGEVERKDNEHPHGRYIGAVIREVRQETGIVVVAAGFVGQYDRQGYRGDRILKYNFRTTVNGSVGDYELAPEDPEEIEAIEFHDPRKLLEDNQLKLRDYVLAQIKDFLTRKHARLDIIGTRLAPISANQQ